MEIIFIPEERVQALLCLEELFPILKEALIDFSAGRVMQPVRTIVPLPEHAAFFGIMPAVYGDVMGAKFVSVYPENANRGLHTHLATMLLFRTDTGELLALMDGRVITAWRTAVVSAIATELLASENASVLAILGSGVQARTHFEALKRVRRFVDVRVWSRNAEHAAKFAAEIGAKNMTAEEAVRGADVVVTVTNASEPVLYGTWLKEGAHVNAVGAVGLGKREIDAQAMREATVVVDSREAALQESGEILHSRASIYAEIGELLAGKISNPEAGRTTIFKSLGIAVEDLASARLVYERACRNNE
ncbi:MAG: ornithine cyclodeaminase family protein [Acidobacteriaceae bacterium]|nr:ornithine cyclodeaminase family protein [Acidobacteriaceae bacterium]MBV9782009.1 ornithine cyclodeaminase family protein [Acidobacteriaceae bacterium]